MNPIKETVDFEVAMKSDVRLGRIDEAERVPKSKKMLKLTVNFGDHTRTVMTNIGSQKEPETLVGLLTPFIVNLAPVTMMGIESQAMIFASQDAEGTVNLLAATGNPGDTII